MTQVTDPLGRTVNYTYDAFKRVTQTGAPLTSAAHKTTQTVYGLDDRVKEVKHNTTGDACDVSYTFTYDNGKNPSETCTSRRLYTRGFSPTGF